MDDLDATQQQLLTDRNNDLDRARSFTEMPTGLPRPRADGMPIPYATELDFHGRPLWSSNDALRRALCVIDARCGICGEKLTGKAVVLGTIDVADLDAGARRRRMVTDRAGLHPQPCWPMAKAMCPRLREEVAAGRLVIWEVPVDDLQIIGRTGDPGYQVPGPEHAHTVVR